MKKISFHILRVGMAVTFLWVGVLIFKAPQEWGSLVQQRFVDVLPFSIKQAMIITAILDMAIGLALLVEFKVWLMALVGAFHLLSVMALSGINAITVRDVGLLAAMAVLVIESLGDDQLVKKFFASAEKNKGH